MTQQTDPSQAASEQKVQNLLIELHEELQQKHSLDENTQALLQQVLADVKGNLDQEVVELEQDLSDRIEQQAVEFEQEHPTLSGILRQIIDTLGRMGV